MDLNPIEIISTLFSRRELHKNYYSVTWKLSKNLNPSDLLGERPFNEYYEPRNFDHQFVNVLRDHRNILIIGPSLAGKSRAIYETLKRSPESFDILIPIPREINYDTFVIPLRVRFWKRGVVILDDLQRFVVQLGFERLIREVYKRGYIIIASSRTGKEFQLVKDKFAEQNLDLNSLFEEYPIEIPQIDEVNAKKVAEKVNKDWDKINFNGTIGSIFMELAEMKTRFASAPDEEKAILRAIKKLYICGVFQDRGTFPIDRIRRIVSLNDRVWEHSTEELQSKEFIKVSNEGIKIEPAYIEEIITLFPEKEPRILCHELAKIFKDDPLVLLIIGDRLRDIGKNDLNIADFEKDAIILYRKVLDLYPSVINSNNYALTLNHLGTAYGLLAEVEEAIENSRRAIQVFKEALKIYTLEKFPMQYAMTQHNLGNVYGILAEFDEKAENCQHAIDACDAALKIYPFDRLPMEYAMTQVNRGISYATLAEAENKAENCRYAIEAFNESLKTYTFNRFPIEYAMTQHNLGNAYVTLAEVEEKSENCRRAIDTYKEPLKIYTIKKFPIEYAMTQLGLGAVFGTLAEVEGRAENSHQAIDACMEALKVYNIDKFPMQYALTQYNLGNAYRILAEVERRAENSHQAIDAYLEGLKVCSLDKFPMQYAMIQLNLGVAYVILAEVEEKAENSHKAIDACMEALKVYNIDKFPIEYAKTQQNLGGAYMVLAEVEAAAENSHKAIDACMEALKVYSLEKFPMEYNLVQKNIEMLHLNSGG